MAYQGQAFAGTVVTIGATAVGVVNSLTRTTSITETEVSGTANTATGADGRKILKQTFLPTAVGETASIAGVSVNDDTGQDAIRTAARLGNEVTLQYVDQDGEGEHTTGFITEYVRNGSLPGAWTFTANFRCNSTANIGS